MFNVLKTKREINFVQVNSPVTAPLNSHVLIFITYGCFLYIPYTLIYQF